MVASLVKELVRGKVVYRPPERALIGAVVMSPDEAPNHISITLEDGNVRYIALKDVVSIDGC